MHKVCKAALHHWCMVWHGRTVLLVKQVYCTLQQVQLLVTIHGLLPQALHIPDRPVMVTPVHAEVTSAPVPCGVQPALTPLQYYCLGIAKASSNRLDGMYSVREGYGHICTKRLNGWLSSCTGHDR